MGKTLDLPLWLEPKHFQCHNATQYINGYVSAFIYAGCQGGPADHHHLHHHHQRPGRLVLQRLHFSEVLLVFLQAKGYQYVVVIDVGQNKTYSLSKIDAYLIQDLVDYLLALFFVFESRDIVDGIVHHVLPLIHNVVLLLEFHGYTL